MVLGGKKAVLDRQLAHGNLQNLIIRYFFHHRRRRMFMTMIVIIAVVRLSGAHWAPPYPCLSFFILATFKRAQANVRRLGLQRIVVERYLFPQILLTEPYNDHILRPCRRNQIRPLPDEFFVGSGGNSADNAAPASL